MEATEPKPSDEAIRRPARFDLNKALVLCKRGIDTDLRHFMFQFLSFIPRYVRAKKFDGAKQSNYVQLNLIAESNGCDSVFMLESRKNKYFLWMAESPSGPTICFKLENMHTGEEMNSPGKCSDVSRQILIFDAKFSSSPLFSLCKEVLRKTFGKSHDSSEKEIDSALSFFIIDDRIWLRRFQIVWDTNPNILEAGPRVCLRPVVVLGGSFCGKDIWRNESYFAEKKIAKQKRK